MQHSNLIDQLPEVELDLFYMVATGLRRQLDGEELEIVESTLCKDLGLVVRYEPTGEWKMTPLGEECAAVMFCAATQVRR